MNISTNTIIKKIRGETEKLSDMNDDTEMVHDVMRNIHLLSELWLEGYQDSEVMEKDNKQMKKTDILQTYYQENNSENINSSDTSIFDF